MSSDTIVILALVFSVAVAAMPRVLPPLAGIWAALKYAYKSYPPEHRWIVIRQILRGLFRHHKRIAPPRTEEEARFRRPDDPVRTVPLDQWHRLETLVTNPIRLTTPEMRTWATALDVDGSVTLVHMRDDHTSDIAVLSPDGTNRTVTGPDGVVSAWMSSPSVDRGSVAWWQVALDGKSAQLWVSEPAAAARVLHTELVPDGKPHPFCPYGWVCIAGDQVVWTMLSGETGTIGVTSLDGTTHRMGSTRYPTVHRDRAAEHLGRRVVAVNLSVPGFATQGHIAQIDLDGPAPVIHALKAGAFPGGSACLGSAVGYWRETRALQLPGGLGVPMPVGTAATDIISDGEWAVGRVLRTHIRPRGGSWAHELFHLPTGATQRLGLDPFGVADIRAGRILWASKQEGSPHGSASSWVGELRAPTPTVESVPTQAAPGG